MNKTSVKLSKKRLFEHFVQFYDSEEIFIRVMSCYFTEGLLAGDICIAIATQEHLEAIKNKLAESVDLERAVQTRKLVLLDATKTLSQFMVKNKPNAGKFKRVIGNSVSIATLRAKHVRAFGEMVALLWKNGNPQGAIELEKLWNNLGATNNFSLLCAYPQKNFKDSCIEFSKESICEHHTKIIVNR